MRFDLLSLHGCVLGELCGRLIDEGLFVHSFVCFIFI